MDFYLALQNISSLKVFNLLFIFFINLSLSSQLKKDWTPPIEIPIQLSGTFGELRNNHFHAGLDIKTQGRQGIPVKSIKAGWINRVRVSVSGYGKALYVEHLDGTTSVYAHLKKFSSKIEAYLKEKQYQKESYNIQLFPKVNELKIESGEIIGYSGNTGGSNGPHLHFEIRDSKGQIPINPMQYPFEISDTLRPQIQNFYLYSGIHPFSNRKEFQIIKKNDSVYTTVGICPSGKINVGLRLFDRQNLSYNKNGIYSALIRLNGVETFSYKMDRISFNDSKYINLLVDYNELVKRKTRIQRFVSHPEQKLSFLKNIPFTGEMLIEEGKSYQILIEIRDYNQNTTYIEAYFRGGSEAFSLNKILENPLVPSKDYHFKFENQSVYFPKKSFFDTVDLRVEIKADTLIVGKNDYPLRKAFEIKYKVPKGDSLKIAQSFLAFLNRNGKPTFFTSFKKDGYWEGKSTKLGKFVISSDTIPPIIEATNFKTKQWLNNHNLLKFKISDDFSGIKKFRGEINGRWILLEHEPKNNSLIYNLNDLVFRQTHHYLKIDAEDQAGNKTLFKIEFLRKSN